MSIKAPWRADCGPVPSVLPIVVRLTGRRVSIQRKLTWLTMVTSAVALTMAFAIYLAFQYATVQRELLNHASSQADIMGANAALTLVSEDRRLVGSTLSALRTVPNVLAACIRLPSGQVFASYGCPDPALAARPAAPSSA